MAIISRGYEPDEVAADSSDREWQLFSQNIDLILKHRQAILACGDYFFCSLPFAYCSWPYVNGDGQLFLGYLLLGWQTDQLIEKCPICNTGKVLITSFAGSPLTDRNFWTGLGLCCRQKQKGNSKSKHFNERMGFILQQRKIFPAMVEEIEKYIGQEFTWGGIGLRTVQKTKIVQRLVAEPASLDTVISGLKVGKIQASDPPNVCLLKKILI